MPNPNRRTKYWKICAQKEHVERKRHIYMRNAKTGLRFFYAD